ncbi:MAG: NPCBM/NEW2 domain-containing protein, partial [Sedimentisphaerales bacterium]|nr:NPCBM/NEW2 domain-containing protein [Sedimentisphaerales bacterium]
YGTEFGIIAERSGKTETLVFQGEIELRTGSDVVRHGDSKRLTAGFAGVVDNFGNLSVNKTKKNINRFVRKIPAKSRFGCPGKRLDLADIVGGGNGFGTGIKGQAINPETGRFVPENIACKKIITGGFVPVEESVFIDGVFMPGCVNGRIQVSSTGDVFNGCRDTDDTCWGDITNVGELIVYDVGLMQSLPYLDNLKYGTAIHPAIYIHSNAGITFDLDAIRSALPEQKIMSFSALCGINETIPEEAEADIRVLVDGKERFGRFGQTPQSAAVSVWLELDKNDRFLTLMVTEGKDGTERDLCLFAEAMLELTMVK